MTSKLKQYDFASIEPFWQAFWEKHNTFKAFDLSSKPKYYALDMLPYPSGAGLHIGHPEGYTATDILARTKKAQGYNVLHPMGWDAFGLPAEQHALATGIDPAVNTAQNISVFKRQLKSLGFALDWDREIDTTDPRFYKWTQWIFLHLFKKGLAYVDEKPVWWCEALGTALANEEVIDGRSERGNHPVVRKALRQWVLRITAYAKELLAGLENLDWPDSTKKQQMAWIGESRGTFIHLDVQNIPHATLSTFTTRADTIYGISFIAIAPEHPLVNQLVQTAYAEAAQVYIAEASHKSDLARTDLDKDKTGVFTGSYAIHPFTQKPIPIWIADYVLGAYGSGAVIGVPGHDERDYAFAQKYGLDILYVIKSKDAMEVQQPFFDEGCLVNSDVYTGLDSSIAKEKITQALHTINKGESKTQYKLRDWLFSRQRYWGEPFPILWIREADFMLLQQNKNSPFHQFMPEHPVFYKEKEMTYYAVPLPEAALPLALPKTKNYKPTQSAESPLANLTEWVNVCLHIPTGQLKKQTQEPLEEGWISAKRETNTMPQWAGSSWYYLRYLDPLNDQFLIDPKIEKYWQGPDVYIGGSEHAVLHLLYARFWHKVLYDMKVVSHPEPFSKLVHQGLILGQLEFTVYLNANKEWVSTEFVSATHTDTRTKEPLYMESVKLEELTKQGDHFVLKEAPHIRVDARAHKMSKSRGNVVNPDTIIKDYGADALRLYEMFLGPLEASKPWNTNGIEGISRFLKKVWRECLNKEGGPSQKISSANESLDTLKILQATIKKVTEDIEFLRFNTAISQMMIFINHIQKVETVSLNTLCTFLQLLAPFAPHISEELWSRLGKTGSICEAPWPTYQADILKEESVKIIIQVNGKMRSELVTKNLERQFVIDLALQDPHIQKYMQGKIISKEIYIPGKILNFVIH